MSIKSSWKCQVKTLFRLFYKKASKLKYLNYAKDLKFVLVVWPKKQRVSCRLIYQDFQDLKNNFYMSDYLKEKETFKRRKNSSILGIAFSE